MYKQALKGENFFDTWNQSFKKLERAYSTFSTFESLLSLVKTYGVELPKNASGFEEIFIKLLREVLREFYSRHVEHFQSLSEEDFVNTLTGAGELNILNVPDEISDAITLMVALDVDSIVSDVYATTKLKNIVAKLKGELPSL